MARVLANRGGSVDNIYSDIFCPRRLLAALALGLSSSRMGIAGACPGIAVLALAGRRLRAAGLARRLRCSHLLGVRRLRTAGRVALRATSGRPTDVGPSRPWGTPWH